MIRIFEKSQCCGCEACVQACPKQCINFRPDDEGFSYPFVDSEVCIQCGLCEKVCPVLHPYEEHKPHEVLAAINKNEEIRMVSSSGGIFTILAEEIIRQEGVVFGVRFNEQWQAVFDYADNKEQIKVFRGSKYIQAHVGNNFTICKQFLDEGRKVLFSGTPCQIAGLLHFLRKPYPNLLTVDFICHGVPSPIVWQRYLYETIPIDYQAITDVRFRDKRLGWKNFSLSIDWREQQQDHTISSPFQEDLYMRAFVDNLTLRPSCYCCPSKSGRSHADITIADFWKIEMINPEMFDDRGTSLILIHTDKGNHAICRESLICAEASYEDVLLYNRAVSEPFTSHPKRNAFFASFNDQVNIHKLLFKCLRPSLKQRIKIFIKTMIFFQNKE